MRWLNDQEQDGWSHTAAYERHAARVTPLPLRVLVFLGCVVQVPQEMQHAERDQTNQRFPRCRIRPATYMTVCYCNHALPDTARQRAVGKSGRSPWFGVVVTCPVAEQMYYK
jgi:hypothetical protein